LPEAHPWFYPFPAMRTALRAHSPVEMQSLKDSSARPWSRCWEKRARLPRPWTRPSAPYSAILLLLKPKQTDSLLLVLRYPIATLSTSVLNIPLFTTHYLLRLLWQSSPFSGILMQFTYSLTLPPLLTCWRGLLIDTHDTSPCLSRVVFGLLQHY